MSSVGESAAQNLVIPQWLTRDYFKEILDKDYEKYSIEKFTVVNATTKGENYASLLLRVSIDLTLGDGTQKTVRYIVKTIIEQHELSNHMSAALSVFPKESEAFEKIFPKINEVYKEAGLDYIVGPKCFKTETNPPALILEDLCDAGYKNINRLEGMDLEHSKATLTKLARFHAASARMYELYGPFSERFKHGVFQPEILPMLEQMMVGMWPLLEHCIQLWGGCEKYTDKLRNLFNRYGSLLLAANTLDPEEFNVLNHGDFWCNNIMFKHNDDGSVADVKFVDLQICNWGSPTLDLQYFIMTSCNYETRIPNPDLIRYYHENLVESLGLLQYQGKIPKLAELQIQMLKRGFVSLTTALGTMSMALLDPTDKADITMFFTQSEEALEFRKQLYLTPRFVKAIKPILEFLDNRGILDL